MSLRYFAFGSTLKNIRTQEGGNLSGFLQGYQLREALRLPTEPGLERYIKQGALEMAKKYLIWPLFKHETSQVVTAPFRAGKVSSCRVAPLQRKYPHADRERFHIQSPAVLLSLSVSPLFPLVSTWEKTRGKHIQDRGDKSNWVHAVQAKDVSLSVSTLLLSLSFSVSVSVSVHPVLSETTSEVLLLQKFRLMRS